MTISGSAIPQAALCRRGPGRKDIGRAAAHTARHDRDEMIISGVVHAWVGQILLKGRRGGIGARKGRKKGDVRDE